MTFGVSAVTYAGMAVTVGGALMQANQNRKSAGAQAEEYRYEGQQAEDAGVQQAAIIQRAGQYAVSRATAAYAASGVAVDSGSAVETSNKITTDSMHDAYMAILSGQLKAHSLQATGSIGVMNAGAAADQSVLAAGSKALSGWASAAKGGWSSMGPNSSGWDVTPGNSYMGSDGFTYANSDLSGTNRGSGD